MKKLNHFLNIIMGSFFGVFVGHSLYVIWNYNTNPSYYAMQSAPWYISILVNSWFMIILFAIFLILKIILRYFTQKNSTNEFENTKNQKVDKGFELLYFNLSYRRKFIRTLWMIPWMILVLIYLYGLGISMYILIPTTLVFAIAEYIQATYNYKKWKEELNSNSNN